MTANVNGKLRYTVYATLVVLAGGAYWLLDSGPDQPAPEAVRKFLHGEGLPRLRPLEDAGLQEPRRDLFAFSKPAEAGIQVAMPSLAPEPAPSAAAPSTPDLLSDLRVDGVVRQDNYLTVLVRLGNAPMPFAVGLGQPFGAGAALSVQSVDGRKVIVFDNTSRTSRSFILSEE